MILAAAPWLCWAVATAVSMGDLSDVPWNKGMGCTGESPSLVSHLPHTGTHRAAGKSNFCVVVWGKKILEAKEMARKGWEGFRRKNPNGMWAWMWGWIKGWAGDGHGDGLGRNVGMDVGWMGHGHGDGCEDGHGNEHGVDVGLDREMDDEMDVKMDTELDGDGCGDRLEKT